MVGVAGKSKGCTTCRRRKIKCDEGKPACERCKMSKRECEGYERYPVFIRRNKNGYERRAPLEEAKTTSKKVVLSFVSPNVEATQLVSWFWDSFARHPPSKFALQSPSHWLDHFMNWSSCIQPLRQALLAVSVYRWSRCVDRPDILKEGRRMYTESLGMTRKALLNTSMAVHDDILATSCVMTLYELFDSSGNSLDGWLDHLAGISRLLEHRGPKKHTSAASRALFEHARYLIMLQDLILRKGSVFGRREWLETPWQGVEKSVEQQIFDYGFKLASVFERVDLEMKPDTWEMDLTTLFDDCVEIYDGIDGLQSQFINPAVKDVFDTETESNNDSSTIDNPAGLMLSITSLGIKLGASASACSVYYQMSNLFALSSLEIPSSMTTQATRLSQERYTIAKRILRCVRLCINQRVGALGAARMIFAMRLTMQQFHPSDPAIEECQALLQKLSGLSHRFKGLMKAKGSDRVEAVPNSTDLIRANASALALQWQRLADDNTTETASSMFDNFYVVNLPFEALTTWAR